MAPKSSIIIPLYIYPFEGAWSELYQSIESHPDTHFLTIVNPGNGPGPSAVPDANYLREIPKLNAYPNVTVLGYVHISFTARPLAQVLDNVATYSRWSSDSSQPGLSVDGIFVDETPNHYDVHAEKFLCDVTEYAKSCRGLGTMTKIVHNPGSIPPDAYMVLADITVVFEDTLQVFQSRLAHGEFECLRQSPNQGGIAGGGLQKRERLAIMVHSMPATTSTSAIQDIVVKAKVLAGSVFFTDLAVQYYESFSPHWHRWIDLAAN